MCIMPWVSHLSGIPSGACAKVESDLGLGGSFGGYSGFLQQLQLASNDLAATWQKKWRKTKFQIVTQHVAVSPQAKNNTHHKQDKGL